MASSSGTSSGSSTQLQNSNSTCEEELQRVMEQRKRKRMISNRESARRSRMRKQKHLDDLMAQVAHLRKENNQILTTYKVTTQQYLAVEAENSVLRTQMMELTARLQSLNEILDFMNASIDGYGLNSCDSGVVDGGLAMNHHPWNPIPVNQQPIMASPDMLLH